MINLKNKNANQGTLLKFQYSLKSVIVGQK